VTGPETFEGELRTTILALAASAVALIVAIRAVVEALRDRDMLTGRTLTAEERDAIMTAASAIMALDERLSATEAALQAITDKLDLLIARSNRPRAMDRGR
jgi:hypothetical protein